MKTLIPGLVRRREIPWWVNRKVTCSKCNGQFLLEMNDEVESFRGGPQDYGGGPKVPDCVTISCPTPSCMSTLTIQNDPIGL